MARQAVTLYLDKEKYDMLKRKVSPKPISREIDDLIRKRLAEMEGEEYNPLESADYGELKQQHSRLVKEVERLERHLKRRKVYEDLTKLAYDLKINRDLSNLEEVTPKILDEWDGLKEDAHQFITLLETVRDKWKVEHKLEEIRKKAVRRE